MCSLGRRFTAVRGKETQTDPHVLCGFCHRGDAGAGFVRFQIACAVHPVRVRQRVVLGLEAVHQTPLHILDGDGTSLGDFGKEAETTGGVDPFVARAIDGTGGVVSALSAVASMIAQAIA